MIPGCHGCCTGLHDEAVHQSLIVRIMNMTVKHIGQRAAFFVAPILVFIAEESLFFLHHGFLRNDIPEQEADFRILFINLPMTTIPYFPDLYPLRIPFSRLTFRKAYSWL